MMSMPIYDKPTWALMRQMVKEMPITPGQVVTKEAVLNWFATHYPKIKEGTVAAHLIRLSTNAPGRVHYNLKPDQDDVFFQLDGSHFRVFDPATDPPPIRIGTAKAILRPTSTVPSADDDEPNANEFAYESDLRDFLSKHLHVIEPKLRLFEEEGITGVEFPAGGRFIDILAVDHTGSYVVIELKLSRGYDRTLGSFDAIWVGSRTTMPMGMPYGALLSPGKLAKTSN
jgi:endonuclease